MKPKLLITLGCSWTEGVGCYIIPMPYDIKKRKSKESCQSLVDSDLIKNFDKHHKFSWSNKVGELLGFDKVINLARYGTSNSHNLKTFFQYVERNNLEDYEILVIWMMTEPSRFSFYTDGIVESFQPSHPEEQPISQEYLKIVKDIDKDPILEQKFYLKSMESFCQINGFDLITTSWHDTFPLLFKYYKSPTYLYKTPHKLQPPLDKDENDYLVNYSFCSHPNENGYTWIANKIVEGIKQNHPKWYSDTPNPNIEWEWDGLYKKEISNLL